MSIQGKIPLFYFSASGYTKYCSELVQRGIQDKNIQVDLIRIKTVKKFPFPDKDKKYPAIGLAFPVYEFIMPRIILIWLYQIPATEHSTPVFIIDTSGGFPCDSAGFVMNLLRKKNYIPLGILEVPTPTSEPFFHNRYYPVGWPPEILNRCYSFGLLLAKRLRTKNNEFIDLHLMRHRFSFLTKYIYRCLIKGKSSFGGFIKYDVKKCNKCGACERVCPMNAINLKNTSNFINLNRCMLCATCIRTCPTHAIKIFFRKRKIPSLEDFAPKNRPGYIDPKNYSQTTPVKLSSSFLNLLLQMIKARKR